MTADIKILRNNQHRPMLRPSIFDPRAWHAIQLPVAQAIAEQAKSRATPRRETRGQK